ncbi:unnamed protein product, partial [Ectocarpus sp. 12 AP-2014]
RRRRRSDHGRRGRESAPADNGPGDLPPGGPPAALPAGQLELLGCVRGRARHCQHCRRAERRLPFSRRGQDRRPAFALPRGAVRSPWGVAFIHGRGGRRRGRLFASWSVGVG